ncbi:MAG: hypothetical protein NZM09_00140 [Ignavibacterium sp.]|nr:hypothetical protein [Ignavibacterium sp.]MDW8374078.1 hypothetical protein [Ignavibacteriales bacterium]
MFRKSSSCPNCGNIGKLHKSHSRNFLERIVNHSYIWATFRCHNCGWRGILMRKGGFKVSLLGVIKTFILLSIVYYIVVYLIKNYTK